MTSIKDTLLSDLTKVIQSWKETDIYAISFFVYDDEDDESKPTLTVGFNTDSYYKTSFTRKSEAEEARWNYAFWPQNEEYQFGYDKGAKTITQWIAENNLVGSMITKSFVELLVQISVELHDSKVIENRFGKPLPILIHELEYYDTIAEQTRRANPNGEADKFINWIMDMYK